MMNKAGTVIAWKKRIVGGFAAVRHALAYGTREGIDAPLLMGAAPDGRPLHTYASFADVHAVFACDEISVGGHIVQCEPPPTAAVDPSPDSISARDAPRPNRARRRAYEAYRRSAPARAERRHQRFLFMKDMQARLAAETQTEAA